MLCEIYKNHLFILFWNILPPLFRVILSLFFYLILTCPFQRVRFLFLFSLWNINLLKSIDAVGKLTYANAVAIRDGRTNGEMHEAMEAYQENKAEMYEYLLEQNAKK